MYRSKKTVALVLALVLTSALIFSGCAGTPKQTPASTPTANPTATPAITTAEDGKLLFDPKIMPEDMPDIIYVAGSWYEMGCQFGLQTSELIAKGFVTKYNMAIKTVGSLEELYKQADSFLLDLKARSQDLYDLVRGMSEGSGLTMAQTALGTLYTLTEFETPECSNVMAWGNATPDGKLIAANNGDGGGAGTNAYFPAVVAFPDNGYAFMQNRGFFSNCSMNEKGVICMCTAGQAPLPGDLKAGLTSLTDCMEAAYRCSTAAEVYNLFVVTGEIAPGSGENFTCADTTGDAFVVEHTASRNVVRRSGDLGETLNYLVASNGYFTKEMQEGLKARPDNITRYNTLEKFVQDAAGKATLATLYYAESSSKYYDNGVWSDDDWNYGTQKSPERSTPTGKTHSRSVFDTASLTMYRHIYGHNTFNNLAPYTTGNLCKIALGKDVASTNANVKADALKMLFLASAELANTEKPDAAKVEYLDRAKEQIIEAMNCTDLAAFAESEKDETQALLLYSRASACFCRAQRYAQCAMENTEYYASSTAIK